MCSVARPVPAVDVWAVYTCATSVWFAWSPDAQVCARLHGRPGGGGATGRLRHRATHAFVFTCTCTRVRRLAGGPCAWEPGERASPRREAGSRRLRTPQEEGRRAG